MSEENTPSVPLNPIVARCAAELLRLYLRRAGTVDALAQGHLVRAGLAEIRELSGSEVTPAGIDCVNRIVSAVYDAT